MSMSENRKLNHPNYFKKILMMIIIIINCVNFIYCSAIYKIANIVYVKLWFWYYNITMISLYHDIVSYSKESLFNHY